MKTIRSLFVGLPWVPMPNKSSVHPNNGTVLALKVANNMRTLLRHTPTGQYFQSLEKWTKNSKKAHDFRFFDRAMRFVTKTGFPDMELILSFERSEAR